jgi:ubiquinone/menaquinone biosynthesis C-methylase UbiE
MSYEPSKLEIWLTLGIGTIIAPWYRRYVDTLPFQENEKVLDFGSGSGILSRHIAARLARGGSNLACVDISARWMKVIRHTLRRFRNVSFHPGHITRVNLPDASFDTVILHFVLHDIPAAERPLVMQTLAGKLKPGGQLLLREPQGAGLSLEEVQSLAASAGLVPQEVVAHRVWLGPVFDGRFIRCEISQMKDNNTLHSSDVSASNVLYTFDLLEKES